MTNYKFINDSTEVISILKKFKQEQYPKIDYRAFVGKLLSITFSNNSSENICLLKPLQQNTADSMFEDFTASIHLFQVSNDSSKWENIFYRLPVDTYDAAYDTIKPKSTITKLTFIDGNQKSKYFKLLFEYRIDSSYFRDTIQIVN